MLSLLSICYTSAYRPPRPMIRPPLFYRNNEEEDNWWFKIFFETNGAEEDSNIQYKKIFDNVVKPAVWTIAKHPWWLLAQQESNGYEDLARAMGMTQEEIDNWKLRISFGTNGEEDDNVNWPMIGLRVVAPAVYKLWKHPEWFRSQIESNGEEEDNWWFKIFFETNGADEDSNIQYKKIFDNVVKPAVHTIITHPWWLLSQQEANGEEEDNVQWGKIYNHVVKPAVHTIITHPWWLLSKQEANEEDDNVNWPMIGLRVVAPAVYKLWKHPEWFRSQIESNGEEEDNVQWGKIYNHVVKPAIGTIARHPWWLLSQQEANEDDDDDNWRIDFGFGTNDYETYPDNRYLKTKSFLEKILKQRPVIQPRPFRRPIY